MAHKLRRDQTDGEKKSWRKLRGSDLDGLEYKRQVQVDGFVAGFVGWDAKPIVEVDDDQYNERITEDAERTRVLESSGYLALRPWNNEVHLNSDGVFEVILAAVVSARRNPSPQPSPQGRGSAGAVAFGNGDCTWQN